jgi:hypothetical protein
VPASASSQQFAAANAQLSAAETTCAQANSYQNYVNNVINTQNSVGQGTDQILQTLADNTSDPNLQQTLTDSIGQPNPINDALQQQLQNMVDSYQGVCQSRMASAQAALAAASPQQSAAASGQQSLSMPGSTQNSLNQAATAPEVAGAPDASDPSAAQYATSPSTATPAVGECPPSAATNVPAPTSTWGSWAALGNAGLVFDVSRVNATTLTWRFLNAGANTIADMQFNYSYVDASSGQPVTQTDVLPYALAPGQSVGGWAAYTATTRGNVTLTITQISCQ